MKEYKIKRWELICSVTTAALWLLAMGIVAGVALATNGATPNKFISLLILGLILGGFSPAAYLFGRCDGIVEGLDISQQIRTEVAKKYGKEEKCSDTSQSLTKATGS